MRKYYAEVAHWGRDNTTIIQFESKRARDKFVAENDQTNNVYAWEARQRGFVTYDYYMGGE